MTIEQIDAIHTASKSVLEGKLPKEWFAESVLIPILSTEGNVLTMMLKIAKIQEETKKELISDFNVELSRAHVTLGSDLLLKENIPFVLEEIVQFYTKWKEVVRHCFKNLNLNNEKDNSK